MGGSFLPHLGRAAVGAFALALFTIPADAQQAVFSGRVTSTAGQPLGGASVGVTELGVGGIADAEGRYTFTMDISRTRGRAVNLTARYIGYKPKRLPITLTEGRVEHNFELEKDILNLEEVIVTGTSEATAQKKATFSISVVDNSQIKEVPSASPLGALQGKVPGAAVLSTSGQPGAEPSIRLRSATSLTGRQDPLIIIDGTITRLSLADVNSEDIERVEVIKGAAASSLYGSDAANGVIQIFTKRGANLAENQTSFTARTEFGQSELPKVLEGNMSHPYKLLANGQFDVSSGGRTADDDGIADNPYPVYHNQLRAVFRPGDFMTNYVSVGQRRGATNFNASFENHRDKGVLRLMEGYRRQNVRLNVDHGLTDDIDIGIGTFYGRSTADQEAEGTAGIFFGLRFIEPNVKIDSLVTACPTGVACTYVGAYNPVIRQAPLSGNVVNPLYDMQQRDRTNTRDRFTGTFRTTYRMLDWLSTEGSVGYDVANRSFKSFTPVGYTTSSGNVGAGGLLHRSDADRAYNANVSVTSSRDFGDMLRNTSKLAFLYEDQTGNFTQVSASRLAVPRVPEFSAVDPAANINPGSRSQTIRARNVFFITTFDIKDRYVLDGLVRQDQSSLFGADERTALYHRLSGAWRVSEDFALPGVDELKLRVSHGTAGLRPPFEAQYEVIEIQAGKPRPVTLGNTRLKPAYSAETEYGFNVNFLQNYTAEYSYSTKRTTDEIIRVPVTAASGYLNQWQNAGTLEGNTHEISIGAVLLSQADYFWRVNVNADRTRQTIADLKVGAFLVGPDQNDANTQIFRIAKGAPFGVIYGSKWIRTQAQLEETINAGALTGTVSDYRVNEEGYYVRNSQFQTKSEVPLKYFTCAVRDAGGACTKRESVVQIGDVNPDFNMGFNTTAQWKALTFTGTLSWVKGGDIYNYTRQWPFNELRDVAFDQSGRPSPGACPAVAVDPNCPYKTGRKPTAYYSAFYNNFDANDFFVESGTYVRLRELAMSWNLPQRWVARVPTGSFRSARLGIVGRNLWTSTDYTGYDPDVTGPGGGNPFAYRVDYFTYPAYRTITAMLELGF